MEHESETSRHFSKIMTDRRTNWWTDSQSEREVSLIIVSFLPDHDGFSKNYLPLFVFVSFRSKSVKNVKKIHKDVKDKPSQLTLCANTQFWRDQFWILFFSISGDSKS